jgi:hypothetical protein
VSCRRFFLLVLPPSVFLPKLCGSKMSHPNGVQNTEGGTNNMFFDVSKPLTFSDIHFAARQIYFCPIKQPLQQHNPTFIFLANNRAHLIFCAYNNPMKEIKTSISLIFSLIFIGFAAFTEGCRSPFDDIVSDKGDSEWAVPLIDTERSFGDIIGNFDPKALVQLDSNGVVTLRYKGDFVAKNSLDIFSAWQNIDFPITDSVMAVPFRLPSGVQVDFADVKRGSWRWVILPSEPVDVELSIEQLTQNGRPFKRSFRVTGLGGDTLDMSGWRFSPRNDSVFIRTIARKVSDGTPVNLALKGVFQVRNFEANYVRGYFGQGIFDGERDTILIDFFEKWRSGSVKFDSPRLIATLDNSFGIPVRAQMMVGEVITIGGQKLQLRSPLTTGVDVNYPRINEVGKSKRTVVVFDKNNSNLAEIVSSNPSAIDYDIDGKMNPDSTTRVVGFLTDSSQFKFQVELEVPMHGSVRNFELNDTLAIDLSKNDKVSQAEFKILTDNKMPIDLSLQGYFLDQNGKILDSLYTATAPILRGAPVGSDGLPNGLTTTTNVVNLSATKFDRLKTAKRIVVKYNISTTSNGAVSVRLKSNQAVRVRIGVRFTYVQ